MNAMMFYLGAGGLFGTGVLCFRHSSLYIRAGGVKYERRKQRRLMGQILFILATIFFLLALVTQLFSSYP